MPEPLVDLRDGSVVNLACFEVAGQDFALEVTTVREIVRVVEVAPLPNAPALIEGVIDLRGIVIPVVDLATVLGVGKASPTLQARIVVLELDGIVLGLRVDAATDVMTIDAKHLEDVPELATEAGYDAIRHVVRREGAAPVMVLSLDALLEAVYRSALSGRGSEGEGR